MDNFYIAFAVYLNLIFVAAKLWDRIEWPCFWVMTPLIFLTIIGIIASASQAARKKQLKGNLVNNLQSLREIIESSKSRRRERH